MSISIDWQDFNVATYFYQNRVASEVFDPSIYFWDRRSQTENDFSGFNDGNMIICCLSEHCITRKIKWLGICVCYIINTYTLHISLIVCKHISLVVCKDISLCSLHCVCSAKCGCNYSLLLLSNFCLLYKQFCLKVSEWFHIKTAQESVSGMRIWYCWE